MLHFRGMALCAILFILVGPWHSAAHTDGYDDCPSEIGNGIPGHGSFPSSGNPFSLQLRLFGTPVTTWDPDSTTPYSLDIVQNTAGQNFKGFVIKPIAGASPNAFTDPAAGTLGVGGNSASARAMQNCEQGLTHRSGSVLKPVTGSLYSFAWNSPSSSDGIEYVTFWAVVVQCQSCTDSLNKNWQLKLTVPMTGASAPESVSATASLSPTVTVSPSRLPSTSASASWSLSASMTSTHTSSKSMTVTSSVSATSSVTNSGLETPTASLSTGASQSVTRTVSASASVTKSQSPSSSSTGSSSITMSATSSETSTTTLTPPWTTSATASVSRVPSADYPYWLAPRDNINISWRVDSFAAPVNVDFRITATGRVWVGFARSSGLRMLNRGSSALGSGPAVVGQPSTATVEQYLLVSQLSGGNPQVAANLRTISKSHIIVDGGMTSVYFSRPLAASGHNSEWNIDPTSPQDFIYAFGTGGVLSDHFSNYGIVQLQLMPQPCNAVTTCQGRGVCKENAVDDPSTNPCICRPAFAGAVCTQCSTGFVLSAGACLTSPNVEADVAAAFTIRLLLPFVDAGGPNTLTRVEFVAQLSGDIASALQVPRGRLNVTALHPGSILADISILSLSSAASSGSANAMLPSTTLAELFSAFHSNLSSPLYAGNITSSVDSTFVPDFSLTLSSPYSFSAQLSGALSFRWGVDAAQVRGQLLFQGDINTWFAMCFNDAVSMVGGDCIVFQPALVSKVRQYTISARSVDGLHLVSPQDTVLADVQSIVRAGTTVVSFARPLAIGGYVGARQLSPEDMPLIFAYGQAGEGALTQHPSANSGGGIINLRSGSYVPKSSVSLIKIAHGSLMAIAWAVLLPIGVLYARFGKAIVPATGLQARWFITHRAVQCAGLIVVITGFVVALFMVPSASHFSNPHHILGLFIILVAVLQPINAFFRPHKSTSEHPVSMLRLVWEWLHKTSGYLAILLSLPNIFLGLNLVSAHVGFYVAYSLVIALVGAIFLFMTVRQRRLGTKPILTSTETPRLRHDQSPSKRLQVVTGGAAVSRPPVVVRSPSSQQRLKTIDSWRKSPPISHQS